MYVRLIFPEESKLYPADAVIAGISALSDFIVQKSESPSTFKQISLLATLHSEVSGNEQADLSKYILPYEKITKNNLIAGQKGFLFTPAHYLNPIGMAVFRQTASDKNDFTSSVVYQNPGWKIEGDTGAQPVE